jgi:hypothetical protein
MKEDHRTARIRQCAIETGHTDQQLVDYINEAHPRFNWGDDDPLELVNFAMRPADPPYDVIQPPDDGPKFRVVG